MCDAHVLNLLSVVVAPHLCTFVDRLLGVAFGYVLGHLNLTLYLLAGGAVCTELRLSISWNLALLLLLVLVFCFFVIKRLSVFSILTRCRIIL